jgi:CelD/BcsL family acetyltransferase involved in cellulose biosynthesis
LPTTSLDSIPVLTSDSALVARPADFSAIPRSAWDHLLAQTPAATPFARWNFHRAWWDAYGDTAHEEYLVCVAVDTDGGDGGDIRAVVPLMHRHEVEPTDMVDRTVLRQQSPTAHSLPADAKAVFFGASYHADYATVLAAPADLPAVARALAEALADPPDPAHGGQPWDAVDLRRLRPVDPALAALERALREYEPEWAVIREAEDVCPVVTAPSGDWDEFLATLDKKARHEIRRKLRRAALVGELSIEIASPTPEAVDAFIALHQARFGQRGLFPSTAGGDRSRRFVHRLAELERSEADGGQLQVGLVRCGGRLVFAALGFDDGQTCYLYNAGMDPAAADVSPGVTGAAEYLRNRMAAGRRRFDFLRGSEPYKYEWGARDEPIERLIVLRRAVRPAGEVAA